MEERRSQTRWRRRGGIISRVPSSLFSSPEPNLSIFDLLEGNAGALFVSVLFVMQRKKQKKG